MKSAAQAAVPRKLIEHFKTLVFSVYYVCSFFNCFHVYICFIKLIFNIIKSVKSANRNIWYISFRGSIYIYIHISMIKQVNMIFRQILINIKQ